MRKLLLLFALILMSALSFSQSPVSLAWSPSTDNVGVAGYCVWINGERHDSTVNTQYNFDVFPAGEYWLTVSAYDAAGNESAQSVPFHVIIHDITRPNVPEIITVEYQIKSARVTWLESEDNVGVAGYNIYLDGVFLDSTNTNFYEIEELTPNEEYRLSIAAYDDAGNESMKSAEFSIKLPEDELVLSIFPNPSNGVFTIKLDNGRVKENSTIQILTMSGQIMYQNPIPTIGTPYVQLLNLAYTLVEGSYIISLIEDNVRTQSLQLIISGNYIYQSENNEWGIKPRGNQAIIIPIKLPSSPDAIF